ncbi:MAG: RidA family protein [Pseudomonadota bacterium]
MPLLNDPDSIHPPFGNYAHGVLIPESGSLVLTSGQLGICKNGAIPESIAEQAELCFDAVEAIVAEAGMTMADVVQLRTYLTSRDDFPAYMAVRDKRLANRRIASTLLIVSGFTRPEFLVEVEAVAYRSGAGK